MQVETLPANDQNKKARKHEFHTIATSKNISKEKINFINKELTNEDINNDFKANLNPNTSKTKKVKNSLNSIIYVIIQVLKMKKMKE